MSEKIATREAYGKALVDLGTQNDKVVVLDADLAGATMTKYFKAAHPDRFYDCGIAEANMMNIAAGLSTMGLIPYCSTFAMFGAGRAYEQIRDDVGYMHTNVKLVASGGGLAYSTLGSTHMALEDVALMRTVPNLVVLCPGDADEVEFCLEEAIKIDGPVFIRMPRQAKEPPAKRTQRKLELGRGEVLADGGVAAALFTYGPSTAEAVEAAEILREQGVSMSVINFTTLKPLY